MRNKIPLLLLALLVVLALGALALSLHESQPNRQVTASFCGQAPQFAPSSIIVACADANYGFTDLAWTQWGRPIAYGHGTMFVNQCTPTCVAGTIKRTSVTIKLYDLRGHHYHTLNGVGFNAGLDNRPVALS